MKRILFILALAVMVSSCKIAGVHDGTPTIGDGYVQGRGYEFSYKGYQYIRFCGYDDWGVVHDPDCPRHNQVAQTLSEWELLQLAIVYTESKFRPEVTGKNQDGGCYQMTPIYVREVNRIAGTDYTHEDVYDPDKAIEIFGKMQDVKNPDHDIDTAIYFHNKSASYKRVVLENLELIKRYETFRAKLIEK